MALQSSQAAAQALTGFNMINAKVSDMKPMTLLAVGAAPPACTATSEGGMTLQSPKAGADKEVNVCANSTEGVYAWGSVGGGGVKVYVFGKDALPVCDPAQNLGAQVLISYGGNTSEVNTCMVEGRKGYWSMVDGSLLKALARGAEDTVGMARGRYDLMGDATATIDNLYFKQPTTFVAHVTGDRAPIVLVKAVHLYADFAVQGARLETMLYCSAGARKLSLSLNNVSPRKGFKQALEVAKSNTSNSFVLTAGSYQVDTDVLTTVSTQRYIDGAVEFVGNSTDGKKVLLPLNFYVRKGSTLTTKGITGFGLTVDPCAGKPCKNGGVIVGNYAAFVTALSSANSGDKFLLICTKVKCCVISGKRLTMALGVEVDLQFVDVKDNSVSRRCLLCALHALFCRG